MKNYDYIDKQFTVYDYNHQSPFANFLPGVAGKMGIPLWVFYSNRGQGISGYGLQDKNHPIMAFTPANKAYETAPITGFRTFIKVNGQVYEAFHVDSKYKHKMTIGFTSFSIEEDLSDIGIKIKVTYYGLVNEPLGGLVRKVEVQNMNSNILDLEILDGIAEILPSGIQNDAFKSTSNLLASWADVKHLNDSLPFFTLRASTGDSSQVKKHESGNFYLSLFDGKLLKPIVDPNIVFGFNTAKTKADRFLNHSLKALSKEPQITTNKFACAFTPIDTKVIANESLVWYSVSGYSSTFDVLEEYAQSMTSKNYFEEKLIEAEKEVDVMISDVHTSSAYPIFDEYVKQNYLDNILRGGYPEQIGNTIYHLYSRRHGDLERDYNFFSLAPEYYSQGNGNFRDVCQNRRLDSFFNTKVKDFNIEHFASLIQMDGYNPLSINGILYQLDDSVDKDELIDQLFENSKDLLNQLFDHPFTPGTIVNFVERNNIKSKLSTKEYLDVIISHSIPAIQAVFGEGFWIDHFTYLIDLIESFVSIYPEKIETLLYNEVKYKYYDSPVTIRNKNEKIIVKADGGVRQYGSLIHFDEEKLNKLKMNPYTSNWIKVKGCDYKSNLFTKLFILILNKHAILDPENLGVEMEAEKPGWNDAMNGLPGLLGSGLGESIELLRIIDFLLANIIDGKIELPQEVMTFFNKLVKTDDYSVRIKAVEEYRQAIRFGLNGQIDSMAYANIKSYLLHLKELIQDSIDKLYKETNGLLPTFLRYEVDQYEYIKDENLNNKIHEGFSLVQPLSYKRKMLPIFLEAPARLLKTNIGKDKLLYMHEQIKKSDLYDSNLNVYKTSVCLNEESHEIGRIHAFTKGWLERESNFLHMTYKYLLGLLKAGLYDEFYEEIKDNLVCFMKPEIYKRSTLENSSFIATSNNPDPSIHGKGFFARLSGSTVEALNMWTLMMTGDKPFKYIDGNLVLDLQPKLHKSFFKEDKTVSFTFLKDIKVTYICNNVENTYDRYDVRKIEVKNDDETVIVHEPLIRGDLASKIRDGHYKNLNIYIN